MAVRGVLSLFLGLAVAGVAAGAAPERVEGKIFRTTGMNERFSFLNSTGMAVELMMSALGYPYTYTRLGESTAQLNILSPISPLGYTLTFTSDTAGTASVRLITSAIMPIKVDFTLVDAKPASSAPMINAALRGTVVPGRPLIAGFVIPGQASDPERDFVLRVAGPALRQFGLPTAWLAPDLELYRGDLKIAPARSPTDWSLASRNAAVASEIVGAFPFPPGSPDAATVVRLRPGPYTIIAAAKPGDPGGDAMIEIYALP